MGEKERESFFVRGEKSSGAREREEDTILVHADVAGIHPLPPPVLPSALSQSSPKLPLSSLLRTHLRHRHIKAEAAQDPQ